jgi:apolipoprotein N-acyltransferase
MPRPRVFLPAMLSGVLLWMTFFPLDLGPLAFIALGPFLTLVRAEGVTRRRRYFAAFVGGCTFFGLAINWVRVAHPAMMYFTWPAGTMYCACYWPLALALLRALDRWKLPFSVTLPVVWVSLEYLRAHFPTGFPFLQPLGLYQLIGFHWYSLGYAVHRLLPFIQGADLGGVYLISLAVACINGSAYGWMMRSRLLLKLFGWPTPLKQRTFVWEAYDTAWTSIFPVLLACYGTVQLGHYPYAVGPRIAAIQGNVPQNEKMIRGDQAQDVSITPLERSYYPLAVQAGKPSGEIPAPDLVIWPETCFPADWFSLSPNFRDEARVKNLIQDDQRQFSTRYIGGLPKTHMLLGLNRIEFQTREDYDKYNSAVLFDPTGSALASYDKMHLVPFGEYVPLSSGFLQKFTPYRHNYSCTPGTSWTIFEVPAKAQAKSFKFGVLICYEDSDPYIARQYNPASGKTPGVDFLVNISNDGWFTGTEEHEQHLAICRFRAIEARRSVVRAVNTGISAIIDPDGAMYVLPDESSWAKGKVVEAVVRGEVPIDTRETYYAKFGDWVPTLTWGALLLGLLMPKRSRTEAKVSGS